MMIILLKKIIYHFLLILLCSNSLGIAENFLALLGKPSERSYFGYHFVSNTIFSNES